MVVQRNNWSVNDGQHSVGEWPEGGTLSLGSCHDLCKYHSSVDFLLAALSLYCVWIKVVMIPELEINQYLSISLLFTSAIRKDAQVHFWKNVLCSLWSKMCFYISFIMALILTLLSNVEVVLNLWKSVEVLTFLTILAWISCISSLERPFVRAGLLHL